MTAFERFVGIDWSGDKERRQKGLQIAVARLGGATPELVRPMGHRDWSRTDAVEWMIAAMERDPCLIGIDFAFGAPDLPVAPMDWDEIDRFCAADDNFYGGRFFRDRAHRYGDYLNGPWGQGPSFSAKRHRLTERIACDVKGASPSCMLNGVGASAVGFSSISGMRALAAIKTRCRERVCVWPFEPVAEGASVIVEVFPRYLACRLDLKPAMRHAANLDAALRAYRSDSYGHPIRSEDEGDAILTAAALRDLPHDDLMLLFGDETVRREGWIFGVPLPAAAA